MKKNAIFAIILAVSMTAAMTSCGPKEEISNGTEQPSYNEAMGIDDKTEEKEEEVVIEPTQEILDAELADKKVQLGTHVYQFPIPLQKLLDDGAVITNGADPATDILEKDENGGSENKNVEFILDEKNYTLQFSPLNAGRIQLKDCVAADQSDYYLENPNVDIIYAKGIRVGSTVEEIKNAWGDPTEDNLDEYRYNINVIENDYEVEYLFDIKIDLQNQIAKEIAFIKWSKRELKVTSEDNDAEILEATE